jgi:hypothetical protein
VPADLPDRQGATVLVYRLGSEVADLVNAVLHPSESGAALRSAAGSGAAEVLSQVRALVGD